mgnify:CR=1 FL=1
MSGGSGVDRAIKDLRLSHQFEVVEHPGLFDVSLERPVETESHEEALVGIGLDPAFSFVLGCLRAK